MDLYDERAVDDYILLNKIEIIIHFANRGCVRDVVYRKKYFSDNLETLDKEIIINDPYLKEINNIWKGK